MTLWKMMNAENNVQENRSAYKNWLRSLPPGYSQIISDIEN